MRRLGHLGMGLLVLALGTPASAQTVPPSPLAPTTVRTEAEAVAGGAWFLDDSAIGHSLVGVAARFWLTPKVSVGPEYTYWVGPGEDRDQTLTGNVTYAFRASGATPFLVGGVGIFRHSDRFGSQLFTTTEGAYTFGGGFRIPFSAGWYVAPELRTGWEPHVRLHVAVGKRF